MRNSNNVPRDSAWSWRPSFYGNTLELARAIEELKSEGVEMTAEQLRHLSPMDWEHIGLTGEYTWDFTAKSSRA